MLTQDAAYLYGDAQAVYKVLFCNDGSSFQSNACRTSEALCSQKTRAIKLALR